MNYLIDPPSRVSTALKLLGDAGFEAYLVGGCVRDALCGIPPHDYDITTDAEPDEMLKVFSGFGHYDSGLKHGTLSVIIGHEPIEITTYRTEGTYSDRRHPDGVYFTKNLSSDLARRDFTVNAMAYSPEKGLVDLFSGADDIKNRIIRAVGEPERRFGEDALRIMRALRFASRLDYEIESGTEKAIHSCRLFLRDVSVERILTEFYGLLDGTANKRVIDGFSDVLRVFIPEMCESPDFSALSFAGEEKRAVKLALFFHGCGIDRASVGRIMNRLHSDRKTASDAEIIVGNMAFDLSSSPKSQLGAFGITTLNGILAAKIAVSRAANDTAAVSAAKLYSDTVNELDSAHACVKISDLDIRGGDLSEHLSLPAGREIGLLLKQLLEAVTDGKIGNTKAELLAYAASLKSGTTNPDA